MRINRKGKLAIGSIDIRILLEELNIHYWEKGKNVASGWIGVSCPFCDDQGNHLGINLRSKSVTCWKCGESGTIIKYLSAELGNFAKAISFIEDSIPRELRSFREDIHETSKVTKVLLPEGCKEGLSQDHKDYLLKRRFNPDVLNKIFNLHHTCETKKMKWKIIIPIVKRYTLVCWTSVDIREDAEIRYIHQPETESIIPVKHLLFGEELSNGNEIIATEGLFDALRFGGGAIPTWGSKFTDKQVMGLSKYKVVKIVGDGDEEGWRYNKKLSTALAPFTEVKYYDLPRGVDPDGLSKQEISYIKQR